MREIVKYGNYLEDIKYIQKLTTRAILAKLGTLVNALVVDSQLSLSFDHPLHKTSRVKFGMLGWRELHVTGEILLIYRKADSKLELIDSCKNHKDLMKRY